MTAPEKQAAARRALLEQRIQLAAQRAAATSAPPQPAETAKEPAAEGIVAPPAQPPSAAVHSETVREAPLAVVQRAVWWFAQLAPEAPVYNEVALVVRRGPLDAAALEAALAEVVARHEAWRTTFAIRGGEPVQIVHPTVPIELPHLDLSHLTPEQADAVAVQRAAEHARRPYDLAKPPLLRALLITVSPDEHRLYLALHHLIFDGVSLYRVALPELLALYGERTGGPAADLPPPTPYSDFVAWERAELARPSAARHLELHRSRLAGAPLLELPLDRPRPARPAYRGAIEGIAVPAAVVDRLRSIAGGCSATLFQVLAAAYAVVLGRFSGQDDVVFGTATDLRRRRELYPVVGLCVSSSVLRVRMNEDLPFTELVTLVRDELADLLDHPVPFDELVRELAPERDQRMHPLFQAGFVFEPPSAATDSGWELALMEVELGNAMHVAKFDLHLEFDERPSGDLAGRFVFNTDLFDRETARRLTRAILLVLEQVVADASRPVAQLAVIPEPELQHMLVDWNATSAPVTGDSSLTALLERQAAQTPEAVAVRFEGSEVTYRELHESANALAEKLVRAGAGVGTIVGLGSERSIEMIVGLLAILKTGAAYLPLDPALPPARLRYMVADAQLPLLLLDDSLDAALSDLASGAISVVQLAGCRKARYPHPPAVERLPSGPEPAYVLYTSGSTGTPKAVVVPHAAVLSMLSAYRDKPGFPAGSRFLALTTLSFDIAAAEIWLPLVSGERMVLGSRADATDPKRLAALIRDERVTNMQGTPVSYQMLLDSGWEGDPQLTAMCGGEHMTEAFAEQLARRCRLWNGYGPTETTVYCTAERIHGAGSITIGRPIQNTRIYLLDRRDRPVPIGVTGELHIAGGGVATGYLHRPELTAQRFVPEYGNAAGRMYRSGDLARYLPDGRIEILGRTDTQIKIRGHRVELGEIESAVLEQSGASAAAVVLREDVPGDRRLVAYLVPGAGELIPTAELRRRLQSVLPGYMLPSAFVTIPALPQTASGKVDRLGLPAPAADPQAENADGARDLTPFERRLAQLWARVLGVAAVDPDGDFFALGGHSLLAVRLVAAIETELGIPMSVARLIDGDVTVRALAARMPQPETSPDDSARQPAHSRTEIVRFNSAGDQPPLIMFFPSRESLLAMRLLQSEFDARQPVIALLAGLDEYARFPRHASIMQIARDAIATLRDLQPPGAAYRIAGYSMAGLVAYEVAGLLAAQGEIVEWLGLVDTYSPSQAAREFSIAVYLERSRGRSLRKSVASAMARVRTESTVRYADAAARIGRRQLDRFDELGARRLMRDYSPNGHQVALDLFVTQASSERAVPLLGWSDIHPGPVQIREIGGDHMSIMQGDSARRLAQALARAQPPAR